MRCRFVPCDALGVIHWNAIPGTELDRELELSRRRALELAEVERQIVLAAKNAELSNAEANRKRQEIVANQEVETSRIAQDRALDQVRLERERLLDALQIAKRQAFEEAEIASGEEIAVQPEAEAETPAPEPAPHPPPTRPRERSSRRRPWPPGWSLSRELWS